MNTNPSLIFGLVLKYIEKKQELDFRQQEAISVRLYDTTGSGYFFIKGSGPGKWYYRAKNNDDHFCNCEISEVQKAIDSGGRVQIVGNRGQSFGVWKTWEEFEKEVLK